jgi:hypothetical protein
VVSCRSGDNKCRETLTFKVESFDIGYNCIHGRLFLLKLRASSPSRSISEMLWHAGTLHCRTSGASVTRPLKNMRPRKPKHMEAVILARHRHPSQQLAVPLEHPQRRRAPTLPQPPHSSPPIRRWTIRRRGLRQKKARRS